VIAHRQSVRWLTRPLNYLLVAFLIEYLVVDAMANLDLSILAITSLMDVIVGFSVTIHRET